MRRGEIVQKPIWVSKFTPNLFMLYEEWEKSKYYRGKLSEWLHVNPSTDISFLKSDEIVSFIPMEAVKEDGAGIDTQNASFRDVAQGYTRFSENDLIWAKITPCMQNGKSGVARNLNFGVGFGSTEFHVLRSKNDEVNIDFIKHLLTLDVVLTAAQGTFSGTAGQQRVPDQFLLDLPLPLPPVKEQNNLISAIETARTKRQSMLAEADSLLRGIDSFVLGELGLKLPKEEKRNTFAVRLSKVRQGRQDALYYAPYYEKLVNSLNKCKHPKIALANISPELVGGATPTSGDAELYAEDGIKFLRILNIGLNEIILDNVNYIQEGVHNGELKRSQLAANDVLMTITGRVGTSAVVTEDILPANINQHIVRMRIERKDCLPEYLAVYLNSSVGTALSNRGVTGGTRIALDYEVIRKLQIPLPSLAIQKRIILELETRRAQARQLREEAERLWQEAKEKFEKALLG